MAKFVNTTIKGRGKSARDRQLPQVMTETEEGAEIRHTLEDLIATIADEATAIRLIIWAINTRIKQSKTTVSWNQDNGDVHNLADVIDPVQVDPIAATTTAIKEAKKIGDRAAVKQLVAKLQALLLAGMDDEDE